ncbi:hypothetical protein C4D60_Mb10t25420 [Musa balbisiana]|uniref:Uncharacterized protein n=1 Tax=Musa balbisiana TaxID=52838 RepID=A0A4S8IZT2_MUSBA|nr:hypothetical protein C4D60_Mb10t25420 [Musa balbisiana]
MEKVLCNAVRIIPGIVILLVIILLISYPPSLPSRVLGRHLQSDPFNNPGQQRNRFSPLPYSPRIFSFFFFFLFGCFPPFATRDTHPPIVIKQSPIDGRLRGRGVQQPKAVGRLQRELRLSPSSSSLVFPCNRSRFGSLVGDCFRVLA